jgi:NitT/TauT family transport system permease protein
VTSSSLAKAGPPRRRRIGPRLVYGAASLIVVGGIWEFAVIGGLVDQQFVAAPSAALVAGWDLAVSGELWPHAWASLQEFLLGSALGIVIGVALGFIMARWRSVNSALSPTVWAIYSVPRTAFVPLLLVWFGIGLASKAAFVFLGVVFPMIANTYLGIRQTDPLVVRAARSFCASGREIMLKVTLPSAIPYLVDGLRLGTGRGLVGVIIAELYVSREGIGFLIRQSSLNYHTEILIFGVILVAVFGIFLSQLLLWLERRFAGWRLAGSGG